MRNYKFNTSSFALFVAVINLSICFILGSPQVDKGLKASEKIVLPAITIKDALYKDSLFKDKPLWTNLDDTGKAFVTDSSKYKEIYMNCEADYPIVWKYEGVTEFTFQNFGSGSKSKSSRNAKGETEYINYFFEFLQLRLAEVYTGKYICYSKEFPERRSEVYIYFPGKNLLVNPRGKNIYLDEIKSKTDDVIIPCATSSPAGISVTLHKSNEDATEITEVNDVTFDPTKGFALSTKQAKDIQGKYFCKARRSEIVTVAEFNLLKDAKSSDRCRMSCEENAQCQFTRRGDEVCRCNKKFKLVTSDPLFFLCVRGCKSDEDCPSNMSCLEEPITGSIFDSFSSAKSVCKNPCMHAKSTAECKGTCKVEGRKAKCT